MANSFWPQETPGHCFMRLRDPVTPLNPSNTAKSQENANLVPRVLSLPPSRKYPGFGWSRGTQNLGANKNVLHGRGSKV